MEGGKGGAHRQMNRTLMVTDSFYPRVDGIAVRTVTDIDWLRSEKKADVHLFAATADPSAARNHVAVPSTFVRPLRVLSGPDGYPLAVRSSAPLGKLLRSWRPDRLYLQSLGLAGTAAIVAARTSSARLTLVWTTDLLAYARLYPRSAAAWLAMLSWQYRGLVGWRRSLHESVALTLSRVLNLFDEIVAPSSKARDQIDRLSYRGEVTMHRAVPGLSLADVAASQLARRVGDRRVVLYLGRLSKEKNLGLLVSAFRIANAVDPQLILRLVGPTGDRQQSSWLEASLRGLGECVEVLPAVGRSRIAAVLANSDMHVTPSLTEMQCLTVDEARSLGVPVVMVDRALAVDHETDPLVHLAQPTVLALAHKILEVLDRLPVRTPVESARRISHEA